MDLGDMSSSGQSSDPGNWGDGSRTTSNRLILAAVWAKLVHCVRTADCVQCRDNET